MLNLRGNYALTLIILQELETVLTQYRDVGSHPRVPTLQEVVSQHPLLVFKIGSDT